MRCTLAAVAALVVAPHVFAVAPPSARAPKSSLPLSQRIDAAIESAPDFAKFAAPLASDAEFVRRVHLDLVGCIPTLDATKSFLRDADPHKRTKLIDALLASPEHARHFANVLDVMLMERLPDKSGTAAAWDQFLRTSVAEDRPYDALVREVLSGDCSDATKRHRAKFFLDRGAEPHLVTRDVGRLFLGTNVQCAQCHDHPRVEDYHQADYYGLLAFVGRTTVVADKTSRLQRLSEKADGEVTFQSVFDPAKKTKTATPRVPGFAPLAEPPLDKTKPYLVAPAAGVAGVPAYSRKARLAAEITRRDNVAFRRNLANRLWAHLMGRGLFEPLDMDHSANPPTHPEVLDMLGEALPANDFRLRGVMREMMLSRTYQRSSEQPANVPAKGAPDYAVATMKPLTPEQMAWSVTEATGIRNVQRVSLGKRLTEATLHANLRGVVGAFVRAYGNPPGTAASYDARMEHALFLANDSMVRGWLPAKGDPLQGRATGLVGDAYIEELYLAVLTRKPDADELKDAAAFLAKNPTGRTDLAWALMASPEFRFNH